MTIKKQIRRGLTVEKFPKFILITTKDVAGEKCMIAIKADEIAELHEFANPIQPRVIFK